MLTESNSIKKLKSTLAIWLFVSLFGASCRFLNPIDKCHLIPSAEKIVYSSYNQLNEIKRSKRDVSEYARPQKEVNVKRNLVILSHYHSSFHNLPKDVVNLYKNDLIPRAINYWQTSLSVKHPYSSILLGRYCAENHYAYQVNDSLSKTQLLYCESACAKETKCGDIISIPEEHLDICRFCTKGKNCQEKGNAQQGVNADFILYISSINTEHCNHSNTVSFASYCQLESKHNRPVAGYINICPHLVSSKKSDSQSILTTLKHEILHALGFSAGLFAFFVDQNGEPLTPRDPITGKPKYNPQTNMHEASEKVIKTIRRKMWKIGAGYVERDATMIVTPRVVDEVRKHYNCPTLEGAELEDQGEMGTRLTHWEKRIFENEAMTGTYTHNSVFSRMTFAFLEDTGWYMVNYSNAKELKWGKNLGCDFVKKSCKDWIDERSKRNESIRPFCNQISHGLTETSHLKYECSENKEAVVLCNLMRHEHKLPYQYRNFNEDDIKKLKMKSIKSNIPEEHVGGSVLLADFCPFMQQVSWSFNGGNEIRDSKCSLEENEPENKRNYILEEYGQESKCFLHDQAWNIYTDKCQSKITVSKTVGCYKFKCDPKLGLLVKVSESWVRCRHKDEIVYFKVAANTYSSKQFSVYYGNLVCSSCEDLCQDKIDCSKVNANQPSDDEHKSIDDDIFNQHHKRLLEQQNEHLDDDMKITKPSWYLDILLKQHNYCLKELENLPSSAYRQASNAQLCVVLLLLLLNSIISSF